MLHLYAVFVWLFRTAASSLSRDILSQKFVSEVLVLLILRILDNGINATLPHVCVYYVYVCVWGLG
jgi:hypothetical protein